MDLIDHWRNYMRDCTSPESFIDWGFYSLMATALQRRVWTSPEHMAIYPNLYVVLCGPPATGKTNIIRQVKPIIRHHLLFPKRIDEGDKNKLQDLNNNIQDVINDEAQEAMRKMLNPPLMLPLAADSTTFESLVQELAQATRTHKRELTLPDGSKKPDIYFHNSICFCLSELSDLFKKKVEDIVRFLQTTYDCQDFRHRTKTQGEDCIQRCCVNLLAGTTPKFVREAFSTGLMGEGMGSRVTFVYEEAPRSVRYDTPELDDSQKASLAIVTNRIKEMNKLYGQLNLSPECKEFATFWFEKVFAFQRTNNSSKIEDWYGRMRLHMDKLAMIDHFANSNEYVMQKKSMERAIVALQKIERKMHLAFEFETKNPLYVTSQKILNELKKGERTESELLLMFWQDLPKPRLDLPEILTTLTSMGQISKKMSMDGKPTKYCFKAGASGQVDSGAGPTSGSVKIAEMLDKYPKV